VSQRISTLWEEENLTSEMLTYAALDAYVSLAIYQILAQFSVPSPLSGTISPHTNITLYHNNFSRIIARGHISEACTTPLFDEITITDK